MRVLQTRDLSVLLTDNRTGTVLRTEIRRPHSQQAQHSDGRLWDVHSSHQHLNGLSAKVVNVQSLEPADVQLQHHSSLQQK